MRIRDLLSTIFLLGALNLHADTPLLNYWVVDGDRLSFASHDLTIQAQLPAGFTSLKIKGREFLSSSKELGGITFRTPAATFVNGFTSVRNLSHDNSQGRNGAVDDGLFLLKITTGWSLPDFEIYAGFNAPEPHDLVLVCSDDIAALRLSKPGNAVSTSRSMILPTDEPGKTIKGKSLAIVHHSGTVLRVSAEDGLSGAMLTLPDGSSRLAVIIPCKGLAPNTLHCRYDIHNGADALTVSPTFDVDSPTMGQGDLDYRKQSHGHWALYEKDAKLDYAVRFSWLGKEPFRGKMLVESHTALGQPHLNLEAVPELLKTDGGVASYQAVIHPRFTIPGVSEVNVHLVDDAGVVLMTDRVRILYDWPSYQPTYRLPKDMNAFWDDTLATLAKAPLAPKLEEELWQDDPNWRFQHVSFNGWQGKRLHALLYIPKSADQPLPVKLSAHPGKLGWGVNHRADGVFGSKLNADERFVSIFPLIRGYEPDAEEIPFNQPWWGPLDNRDDYVARSWFTAMVRALDYMATRPEIADMSRIAVTGGSQGGALAIAAAALDPRIDLCISDCPSNAMHNDAVRPDTYSTFGPSAGQIPPGQTLDDLLDTLSYYDPANLAPRITCPTLIQINVGDLTVHSMGGLGIYKNLTQLPADKKWFMPGVNGVIHGGSRAGAVKAKELLDALIAQ